MRKISHHTGSVIIEAEKTGELLVSRYDETYPTKCFRGTVNLIGGNHEKEDKSPLEILLREINQELSSDQKYINDRETSLRNVIGEWRPAQEIKSFASERDISIIKNEIISNIMPYKDYLCSFPSFERRDEFGSLASVFVSKIRQEIFELARKNLNAGKGIKNEGFATICSFEELEQGKILCAWASPCILSAYKDIKIPNPHGIKALYIGKPRNSMRDYTREFEYKIPV